VKYRSKSTECEAMQWDAVPGLRDGFTAGDVVAWVNASGGEACMGWELGRDWKKEHNAHIAVRTINGWAYAAPGDYIVRSAIDFYPSDPETFEKRWGA
jgi:hypothetical protein